MNDAHPHSIITGLPLCGLLLGLSMIVIGRFLRIHALMRLGLWVVVFGGLMGLGVYLMGHRSASEVSLPVENVFTMTLPSAIMGGIVSSWALFMDRRGRRIMRLAAAAITFTAIGAAGSLAWAAWSHGASSSSTWILPP